MSSVNEHLRTAGVSAQGAKASSLSFAQAGNKLTAKPTTAEEALAGKDGFSFGDLVDVINPLQHIPGVSSVYRSVTGDSMGAAAKVAGGALFGGPIGAGLAAADALLELATGDDAATTVADAFTGEPVAEGIAPTPTATVLSADTAELVGNTDTGDAIAAAVADAADGAVQLPDEEDEKKKLAAAVAAEGPFRLGVDTVAAPAEGKAEKAAEALAAAVKPEVDRVGIALNPDVSDVATKALGGTSLQHQLYRQAQSIDSLYSRALDMSS